MVDSSERVCDLVGKTTLIVAARLGTSPEERMSLVVWYHLKWDIVDRHRQHQPSQT